MSEEIKDEIREDEDEGGINLFDYLIILAKRKALILKITLPVAIISITISLLSTVSFYESEVSILPPDKQDISLASQFMNQLGVFQGRGGGNVLSRQELLVEIIKSRTFTDKVIKYFDLENRYSAEDMDVARTTFQKNLTIDPDFTDTKRFNLRRQQSPLIRISVRDNNAQKSAEMANAIVEELKLFVNNIAVSEASQKRLFFEEQLKQASESLVQAEEDIKKFQEKTGILEVQTQSTLVIEKIAALQAQITAQEIQMQVMKSYSTISNPDVQRVEETIKALKKELAKLETQSNSRELLTPTGNMPALGLEYKRIFRQLKFTETLYEILVKQYEIAKLEESKDAFLLQVIDKAVPPDKKKSTRTWGGSKALATTVTAFLFSCFLSFFVEYRERSPKNERIDALKKYLSFRRKT